MYIQCISFHISSRSSESSLCRLAASASYKWGLLWVSSEPCSVPNCPYTLLMSIEAIFPFVARSERPAETLRLEIWRYPSTNYLYIQNNRHIYIFTPPPNFILVCNDMHLPHVSVAGPRTAHIVWCFAILDLQVGDLQVHNETVYLYLGNP